MQAQRLKDSILAPSVSSGFIFASCCFSLLNKTFRLISCGFNSVLKSRINEVRIAAVNHNKESRIPNGLLIEELR